MLTASLALAARTGSRAEFAKSGVEREGIRFTHMVRMQYYGQLIDIELDSPHAGDRRRVADATI